MWRYRVAICQVLGQQRRVGAPFLGLSVFPGHPSKNCQMKNKVVLCCLLLCVVVVVVLVRLMPPRVRASPATGFRNWHLGVVPGVSFDWESDYLELLLEETSGKTIYIFSSNMTSFEEARRVVLYGRPDIVIHLSDEFGDIPEFTALAELCPLMLRQHDHPGYPHYPNLHYMPLGFMKGMFPSGISLAGVGHGPRRLVWSFVGVWKKNRERREMVATLSELEPNFLDSASPAEMADIYTNSEFVPNTRGDFVMDCFRLYECSICGAVPVLVGPAEECALLVSRMRNPPWMVHESWGEALKAMRQLRKDPAALKARGDAVRGWWWREVKRFQALLAQ